MSDIQRYDTTEFHAFGDNMVEAVDGNYVKYDDHIAEVEEVKRKVYEGFMSDLEQARAELEHGRKGAREQRERLQARIDEYQKFLDETGLGNHYDSWKDKLEKGDG